MNHTARCLILAATVSLPTACQGLGPLSPEPDAQGAAAGTGLRTDGSSYLLEPQWVGLRTEIGISFANMSDRRMYIPNCNGGLYTPLEKRVDGGWESYWSPLSAMCSSAPIIIEPGATLNRTINVWGALPLPGTNAAPGWASTDVEGTYRMVLGGVFWNGRTSEMVPLELRTSNEFTLRR
jgi:hypothetical protein